MRLVKFRPVWFEQYEVDKRPFINKSILFLVAVGLGIALTQMPPLLSLGILVGTAVLLLILRYPIIGLGFALLAGPWGALESLFLGATLLDSGQLFLLLTLTSWFIRGLYQKKIVIPRGTFFAPMLLFLGVAFVSVLDAPSLTFGIRELIKWVEMWLIMMLLLSEVSQFDQPQQFIKLLVTLFLLSGFGQALIGIWQFGLRGIGPEHFIISGNFYRAYGTFEQPNPFGGLMHVTALFAIGIVTAFLNPAWHGVKAYFGELKSTRVFRLPQLSMWPLFVVVCAGTAVLALLFSWSRGAWLGFAAGGAVLGLFWSQKRWIGFLGLVVIICGLALGLQFDLLPSAVDQRLLGFVGDFQLGDVRGVDINDSNYSVLERLAHWQAAVDMARDQLWLGVGFGNYEAAYGSYALINWPAPLGHAHNYYLNILAETGMIGLVTYLFFWFVVFKQTIGELNRQSGLYRGLMLGLLACWVALSVHHLVDKLFVNNLYIHFGVLLGFLQTVRMLDPKGLSDDQFNYWNQNP